jgi:hypothetical protein
MKTIKFVGYLFYRYYSKGPRANIPYFSALCSMTLLGFFHLMQLLIILDKVDLIPIEKTDNIWTKRLVMFLTMLPIYFIMTRLFRTEDLPPLKEKYDSNRDKVFKGNIWLIVYAIISFSLIFALTFLKRR